MAKKDPTAKKDRDSARNRGHNDQPRSARTREELRPRHYDGVIAADEHTRSQETHTLFDVTVLWKKKPDEHDYPAAANYLSLLIDSEYVPEIVDRLRQAPVVGYYAKDILRASALPLLGMEDTQVRHNIGKVFAGKKLSPVLLVRGHHLNDSPLIVADGYHRICASYHLEPKLLVPARIVTARPG